MKALKKLAYFESQKLKLEVSESSPDFPQLDFKDLTLMSGDGIRTEALYRGRPVIVEWKNYVFDPNPGSEWNQLIENRVKELAILLGADHTPHEFRTLHCMSYLKDPDEDLYRYGLVYEKPVDVRLTAKSIPLFDLFSIGSKASLSARIKLASTLAKSLLYLHAVDWLHKSIRSDNILFFVCSSDQPDYTNPTLADFDYARPDLPGEQTDPPPEDLGNDIYRHPDSLNQEKPQSRKNYDVYSLGVVLVEIAYWKRLDEIVKIPADATAARRTIRNIRYILHRDDMIAELEALAGNEYV